MKSLVAKRSPEDPFIFLPRRDTRYDRFPSPPSSFPFPQPENKTQQIPQYIPIPYPVPTGGNQDNNKGGFNIGKAIGAFAGALGMGFGNPAFTPGPVLAGRYADAFGDASDMYGYALSNNPGVSNLLYRPGIDEPGVSDFLYRPGIDKGGVELLGQMPRRIQGNYRPAGVFGSPPPNLDSPFMDERIKRGFVPMTPPPSRGGGPQLPGFV